MRSSEHARVGSVVNAIEILRHLADSPPQGVNAIARALSLNPSSCFNLLKTLTDVSLLEFDTSAKTYRPGPPPAWLVQPKGGALEWIGWVRAELEEIAHTACVTCGLWQVAGDRVILTEVADSPLETRIHVTIGQRLPSHIGAMGRCISAREGLSKAAAARIMSELRWQNPPTVEAYWNDMQNSLRRGWAVDSGNYLAGVTTVASAVTGTDVQTPRYCLTATLFSGQYDEGTTARLAERLATLAAEAARRLPPRDR